MSARAAVVAALLAAGIVATAPPARAHSGHYCGHGTHVTRYERVPAGVPSWLFPASLVPRERERYILGGTARGQHWHGYAVEVRTDDDYSWHATTPARSVVRRCP